MRCDGWGCVIFRPSGEIFREKSAQPSALLRASFPMRPHACTEGTRRSEAGECASAARGQRCRLGKHEEKSQGHGAFRKSRAVPLMRERPLAPLMTCSRVLA